jgi:hypothetical protein
MFCPQCKAEFRSGFTRCSDCDIELVDAPLVDKTDSEQAPDAAPVVVATAKDPLEEEQIVSFLGAHGIPAEVSNPAFRQGYGFRVTRILVPQKYAVLAFDLLAKADRGEFKINNDFFSLTAGVTVLLSSCSAP